MKDFIAIDFETANPKRVSACSIGYAAVSDGAITETGGHLIKPVGGHASFQSKIHGIKDEHTADKPEFDVLFSEIRDIFDHPLVGHSLFDKQVLNALSDHFGLKLTFDYTDSSAVAKEMLPDLKNHKLKTVASHFKLPEFKHHDATEDAKACANILLRLQDHCPEKTHRGLQDDILEFSGLARGILADDDVNYKEAYELLYWLEDHTELSEQLHYLHLKTNEVLDDNHLDSIEAIEIKGLLEETLLHLR